MTAELAKSEVVREHDLGLHAGFDIQSCPKCEHSGRSTTPQPRHIEPEEQPLAAVLRAGRRSFVRPGLPVASKDGSGSRAPDGGPLCAICGGARWLRRDVPVSDPEFGKPMPCPASECRAFQLKRHLDTYFGGMPDLFREWTLGSFAALSPRHADLAESLWEWVESPGSPSLVLVGPIGVGKTGAAVGCGRALAERGQSVVLRVVSDLLDILRDTYDDDRAGASQLQLLDLLSEVDVLCLDDIGKEQGTDWGRRKLFQIINRRHDNKRRTIITSNKSMVEIQDSLSGVGVATVSRIGEMTHGGRWIFTMRDYPNVRNFVAS